MEIDMNITEQKFKRVVRGGKIVRKLTCKPGYKAKGGKCVRMDPRELRKRKVSAKRRAVKMKGRSKAGMLRKRAISMRRRKGVGKG